MWHPTDDDESDIEDFIEKAKAVENFAFPHNQPVLRVVHQTASILVQIRNLFDTCGEHPFDFEGVSRALGISEGATDIRFHMVGLTPHDFWLSSDLDDALRKSDIFQEHKREVIRLYEEYCCF